MMKLLPTLELGRLSRLYAEGTVTASAVLDEVYRRVEARGRAPIWIELVPRNRAGELLARAEERRARGERLPLYGVPFAIKDNIDLAGVATTAGCPAFRYVPEKSATAVARLLSAGAVPIGKTNLDQFATGLVGVRSPFGACGSAFDERYVAGGSSSGSALAVAHAQVSFSLGTDTAGSGRVPAGFNNLVGVKPTRGLVSTHGVVPACRSLDCVSVFAGSVPDAQAVLEVLAGSDPLDPFSRAPAVASSRPIGRVGVPKTLEFFGNVAYEALFASARQRLAALGASVVEVSIDAFLEAATLLYGGPWVAERYAAVGEFMEAHLGEVHPVVRDIVLRGKDVTGVETFRGSYRLQALRQRTDAVLADVDALLLPTTGTHPTVDAVLASPVQENTHLGRYTNFMNLLDLAAIAVPAGFTEDHLPFGVTLVGPAFSEARLLSFADRLHRAAGATFGATGVAILDVSTRPVPDAAGDEILLAVAGAHLSGQPLNGELTSRGARLVCATRTARSYKLYALSGTVPPKPGLVRAPDFGGPGIEVEVWALSAAGFGSFVGGVPAPMVIGSVELEDQSRVKGFLCEPYAVEGSRDITALGGWRAFLAS